MLDGYKREFIEFMVRSGALSFGDFLLKSGRRAPFFINTARYRTGEHLARLGSYYANRIRAELGDGFDVLFGPAYKGIPLVTATALSLSTGFGHNVSFCFNRRQEKDHAEGGVLVGHIPQNGERLVIVEDVTTAGTSIHDTVPLLRAGAPHLKLTALIVSVDRQERGRGSETALQELSQVYGMKTFAIVTLDEIVAYLRENPVDGRLLLDAPTLERIAAYRAEYGPR